MIKYDGKKITVPEGAEVYKLSSAQTLLKWTEVFSLEPRKAKSQNILSMYMVIDDDPDIGAIQKAYNKVIEINDALRLVIFKKGGKSLQFIRDFEYEELEVVELGDTREDFDNYVKDLDSFLIPWTDHPLVWAKIVKFGTSAGLVMRMHHAVSDGFSLSIVIRQLDRFYNAYKNGEEPDAKQETTIVKFFEKEEKYKSSPMHDADRKFWRHEFNHQRKYSFPAGYRSEFGAGDSVKGMIEGKTYERLMQFCADTNCSLQSVLLAIMVLTVYCVSGKENFCIYSMTHGRNTPYLKKTVGCMMNTVPVFFDVNDEEKKKNITDFVSGTYMNYLLHLSHGNLSMSELTPMTYKEAFLHFLNFNHAWMVFSSLELAEASNVKDKEFRFIPFTYLAHQFYGAVMEIKGKGIKLGLDYQIHKYKKPKVEKLLEKYKEVAAAVVFNPDKTVEEIAALCK